MISRKASVILAFVISPSPCVLPCPKGHGLFGLGETETKPTPKKLSTALRQGFILCSVLFLSLNLVSAITGSIGNAKMILYPEVDGVTITTIERTILVKNVNKVSINVSLVSDNDFIEIIDKNFVLKTKTEKKAEFLVKVKDEGKYEGRINVFFSLADEKGAGIVLSSEIIVIAKKNQTDEEDTSNDNNNNNDDEDEGDDEEDEENNDLIIINEETKEDENNEVIVANRKTDNRPILLGITSFVLLTILGSLIYIILKQKKVIDITKLLSELNRSKKWKKLKGWF